MNWVGTRTLMRREVDRFLDAPLQTIATPLVQTTVWFVVFGLTWGRAGGDTHYARFIVPGLIFLSLASTAFVNSSTSLLFSKSMRTLEDLMMAPLTPAELLLAFVFGGVARSLLVAALSWLVVFLFDGLVPAFPVQTVLFALLTAWLFSTLGALSGLWAQRFDQVNFWPVFFIFPLTFLGGVFYRIENLGPTARLASEFNPMAHLVRAMRWSMIGEGVAVGPVTIAVWCVVVAAATIALYQALRTGWKLKS